MKYFDFSGQETDQAWFLDTFGDITIEGHSDTYHVSEFWAVEGPASIVVTVLDADRLPIEDVLVQFCWPDGQVDGYTDGGGAVGFGMGSGAWYKPNEVKGPHSVIVNRLIVDGLGMTFGSNHAHANPVFQTGSTSPSPVDFDIIDKYGTVQDATWLKHYFGTVEHHVAEEEIALRLVELREVDGGDCKIAVHDADGNSLTGMLVSFRRADGTGGSSSETDSSGVALFPLNDDAMYPVPGQGPYLTIIRHHTSDAVVGLGRVMGTTRHLDVTFRAGSSTPEPEPPTPDDTAARWAMLFEKMDRMIELLEAM